MPEQKLSIGRFARLTRLSVKQLRRYDEIGLLTPATVDAATGYRYYRAEQAPVAARIGMLRELDVPLAVVRELLTADPRQTAELLRRERERRAAELDRVTRAFAMLTRLADDGVLPEVAARAGRQPASRLAVLSAPTGFEDMGRVTRDLAGRLTALVPDPAVPFVGLFPLDLPPAFDVILGVELADWASVPAGTREVVLADGPVLSATHQGPVDGVALSWWPLLAHVHERGLTPCGALRERYVDDETTILTVPLSEESA